MPPINLLIKPASSACNLACRYCFYADVSAKRTVKSYGRMSYDTLETLVQKTLETAEGRATFAFQGGEPTMAGLRFFKRLIEFEEKHNTRGIEIGHAIQTNGVLLDENWAAFFKEHNFLVGLSLDGTRGMHDRNRVDEAGQGTFQSVWDSAKLLEDYGVPFNILTVVTKDIAQNAARVYDFYMSKNLRYMQFIPCLDPLGEGYENDPWSLSAEDYGTFLCELFDCWYRDITRGQFVYIRFFENLIGMLHGIAPEACGMYGVCQRQLVVEADGEIYPCDFYVLDEWKLGNINDKSFAEIEQRRDETGFIEMSIPEADACKSCRYKPLCRGGCRRDREPMLEDESGMSLNYFCAAYKRFYAHALPGLERIAARVRV